MDLPHSAYHLQSLNQMLELSETNACLHNLHSVRELDTDGDFLIDVGHTVSGILEGILDRIMHLALLTNLCCFRLDLRLFFSGNSCHCYRIDLLMRLPVPFVESWKVRSALPLCLQRTPCFVQNSSIEIFFESPSAWYKNQRLSKSFELYTIDLILKTSPARPCRLACPRKVSNSLFIHNTSKLTAYNFNFQLSLFLIYYSYKKKLNI